MAPRYPLVFSLLLAVAVVPAAHAQGKNTGSPAKAKTTRITRPITNNRRPITKSRPGFRQGMEPGGYRRKVTSTSSITTNLGRKRSAAQDKPYYPDKTYKVTVPGMLWGLGMNPFTGSVHSVSQTVDYQSTWGPANNNKRPSITNPVIMKHGSTSVNTDFKNTFVNRTGTPAKNVKVENNIE